MRNLEINNFFKHQQKESIMKKFKSVTANPLHYGEHNEKI